MKKEILKRFNIFIVLCIMAVAVIIARFNIQGLKTFAENTTSTNAIFGGIAGSPNGEALYDATNTYKYKGDNTGSERSYEYYDTSTNGKNNNVVSTDSPMITVLTHGLGGSASHWSNDGGDDFAPDEGETALFFQLKNELTKRGKDANIYWAVAQNSSFNLYDLLLETNIGEDGKYQKGESITKITDISKHIIIIFESSCNDDYNYRVYEEFNYVLSKIVYDVKQLNGGELPRINLIGHSRGGITNLMYALDHPDMVASMFSLGTPYFGSDTASTDLGACLATGVGRLDIIDRDIYLDYYNRWHDNYDRLYSNIDAHALGGYSDSDFVFDAVIESNDPEIENIATDDMLKAIKWAIKSNPVLINSLNGAAEIADFVASLFRDESYSESELESYIQIIADIQYIISDENQSFWENVWDTIVHNIPFAGCPYFMNDLLVDLSSQIGIDEHSDTYRSYGFNVYTKCYQNDDFNETDKKLSNSNMPAVVHNLEARDQDMISYILTRIPLGVSENRYIYRKTSATTVKISGYRGSVLSGEVELPAQVDGYIVDSIGSDLFKGMGGNITSIRIPASVQDIDREAFVGMTSLCSVEIAQGSQLKTIGSRAFSGCTELEAFSIPGTVSSIDGNAFAGCVKLSEFTVESTNQYFCADEGVLFNLNKTELICYPAGKTDAYYMAPSTVKEVAPFAFCGNKNLIKLDLVNTSFLRRYALSDCSNLYVVIAPKMSYMEMGALDGTEWLNRQTSDVVKLGDVLVLYQGEANKICIEQVRSIAPMAFAGNKTLESITLNYGLSNIGEGAFLGCENLSSVYLCNTYITSCGEAAFDGNAENRVFYVPCFLKDVYPTKLNWERYEEDFDVWETEIVYQTNGGNTCENGRVFYYDFLDLPTPEKRGYTFEGWYSDSSCTGEAYNEQTRWTSLEESVTFYAKWNLNSYAIIYVTDYSSSGDILEQYSDCYTIEESVVYDLPEKTGYVFGGWFKDYALTQSAGEGFEKGNSEDQVLYAKWNALSYTVSYDLAGGEFPAGTDEQTAIVVFDSSDYQLPVPIKTGFAFNGWRLPETGELYTNCDGRGNQKWDVVSNVTLVADWVSNIYYIQVKFDDDSTYGWLSNNGVCDTEESMDYEEFIYSPSDLVEIVNPEKKSLKEGYKLVGFFICIQEEWVAFESWHQIALNYASASTVLLMAEFEEEKDFCIRYFNEELDSINADYGKEIVLGTPTELTGYTFSHWIVASVSDCDSNSRFEETVLAQGEIFSYCLMPDLSCGMEEDGVEIWLQAVYEPNQYQVVLRNEFGYPRAQKVMVEYGSDFLLPVPNEVRGREFLGWFLDDQLARIAPPLLTDQYGQSVSIWQIAEDVILDAAWRTIFYEIRVILNADSCEAEGEFVTWYSVEDKIVLKNPEKGGWKFVQWIDCETGEVLEEGVIPLGSIGNKKYLAQWEKLYTISFDSNGGEICEPIIAAAGETIILPTPTRPGYKGSWGDYEFGAQYIVGEENKEFKAVWDEKPLSECYVNRVYQVYTVGQFKEIREVAMNASNTYELMTDIDLGNISASTWTPISCFNGCLDGNGHTISGLIVRADDVGGHFGLFGINYGTIKNLTVDGLVAVGGSGVSGIYVGMICGENKGVISYCANKSNKPEAEVTYDASRNLYVVSNYAVYCGLDDSKVGGIAGRNYGIIEHCTNNVSVYGRGDVGGIVGANYDNGSISYCINDGQVAYLWAINNRSIGGIVGYLCSGEVNNCSNYDLIKIYNNPSDSRTLEPKMGQIVGHSDVDGSTYNNSCYGNVDIGNLQMVTWKGGVLNLVEYSHDQTQYAGNREIGLNETE